MVAPDCVVVTGGVTRSVGCGTGCLTLGGGWPLRSGSPWCFGGACPDSGCGGCREATSHSRNVASNRGVAAHWPRSPVAQSVILRRPRAHRGRRRGRDRRVPRARNRALRRSPRQPPRSTGRSARAPPSAASCRPLPSPRPTTPAVLRARPGFLFVEDWDTRLLAGFSLAGRRGR